MSDADVSRVFFLLRARSALVRLVPSEAVSCLWTRCFRAGDSIDGNVA